MHVPMLAPLAVLWIAAPLPEAPTAVRANEAVLGIELSLLEPVEDLKESSPASVL